MLFTITQAELKYKELDNYHYVVTNYNNNDIIEKEECWYKNGISKTIITIYQENTTFKRETCINYNLKEGYINTNDSEKIFVNVDKYNKDNPGYSTGGQLYDKLPVQIKKDTIFNTLIRAIYDSNININFIDNNIFFYCDNVFINLEKGTMKPVSFYYKDNNLEKFITSYFIIELNCVDELKI